jgi:hypothetical protein
VPAPPRVLLVRLEVAHPNRREREDGRLHRAGRDERDLLRPRKEPVRDLEAGVPLADDQHALARIPLRRAGVDVVRGVVEAGERRAPRLGDAEREDGGAAPVVAVRGREHEPLALAPRRLPLAAVADPHRASLRERLERGLHLRARREVHRPVHEPRHQRLVLRFVPDEAVVVVPLVLACPVCERRLRPRPADQPLVDGEATEHATGRVVAREGRDALDPGACERIRSLEPAGPAADHDDVVLAGREGAFVYSGHT